jgi:pimeloyl-ACP methyl ester carboxylesterase
VERLHSVVFAAAVPPYMARSDDDPDGPLPSEVAQPLESGLRWDRDEFFDEFTTGSFSVAGTLAVSERQRQEAIALCRQSEQAAALGCMQAFSTTDIRADLRMVSVPTLVLHGSHDTTVPFEGRAPARTRRSHTASSS